MMNAEQMFEELNLEQIRNDDNYIEYVRNGLGGYISILFSLRWKSIKSTYGYQARGTNYHEIPPDELKAIIQQAKELGWLEEKDENFEEKPETNYEHYKDEIIENCGFNFALVDGKPHKCACVSCSDCGFSTGHGCSEKIKEWLKKPYKKQTYKLTQFEYDLLSVCKDYKTYNNIANQIHLFKMREKGYFKDVDTNIPIREILDNCEVIKR